MEREQKNKIIQFKRLWKGIDINTFFVAELLQFSFLLWFIMIMLVGISVTLGFVEEDYRAVIKYIFGSVNVCVFFDFPPTTYVLPTAYAMFPVLVFQYCIMSILTAWNALEDKKISTGSFMMYTCTFIYSFCSSLFFATSFAIQPDLKQQETILLHSLPFTNIVIALAFLRVAITWFGLKVSWNGLKTPKVFKLCSLTSVLLLVLTSIMKVTQHINTIASLENSDGEGLVKVRGVWWHVENESIGQMFQVIDVIWMVCALLVPLIQSGYLCWRNFDTLWTRNYN